MGYSCVPRVIITVFILGTEGIFKGFFSRLGPIISVFQYFFYAIEFVPEAIFGELREKTASGTL